MTRTNKPVTWGMIKTESLKNDPGDWPGLESELQILARVPVSRMTWYNWKVKGLVPYIRIGRRCLYHWPSVLEALLRLQRGGTCVPNHPDPAVKPPVRDAVTAELVTKQG